MPYARGQAVLRCSSAQRLDFVCRIWCFWGTWTPFHSPAPVLMKEPYTPSFCPPCTGTAFPIHRPVPV